MGREKYLKKIEVLFNKSPVVNISSISRIIRSRKNVKQYPKQLIRNLILKGKIRSLTKGYYTIHEESSLAVFCFKPAYLGLQDALSYHNLWEQETIPIIITSKKVRQGIRKILGVNVLIRRIDKKYLFGFEYKKQGEFYLPLSDIEKTLIDMIYFKHKLDLELLKNFRRLINEQKLKRYLSVYPQSTKKRVLQMLKKN
mgnify:CR=1 FL=1